MSKTSRPTGRLGLRSDMLAPSYEQRPHSSKPARNRVRQSSTKAKSRKPAAHRVGRSPKP